MNRKFTLSFFDTNPLILFCVIFAAGVLINGILIHGVILGFFGGRPFTIGLWHLIDTAILSTAPVMTIVMFSKLPFLKKFDEKDSSPWIIVPLHYVISCALLLLVGFAITTVRSEFASLSDYFALVSVFTQGYVVVVILAILFDITKMEKVNKNLKKIQESQERKSRGTSNEESN